MLKKAGRERWSAMAKRIQKSRPDVQPSRELIPVGRGNLKVFISWSGDRSRFVANALNEWLPDVIEGVSPWVSTQHLDAGTRWNSEIDKQLKDTNFGIVCLTRENLQSPWILFESGALAKAVEVARVVPYLLGVQGADVKPPLGHFNYVMANQEGTLSLLGSLNKACGTKYEEARVQKRFSTWWPELEKKLAAIPKEKDESEEPRDNRELLEELIDLTRRQSHSYDEIISLIGGRVSKMLTDLRTRSLISENPLPDSGYDLVDYMGPMPIWEAEKMGSGTLYCFWLSLNEWLALNDNDETDPDLYRVHEQLAADVHFELKQRGECRRGKGAHHHS
jgi:hypothetical protein